MRHLLLACLFTTACLRTTEYRCQSDTSCGAGGVCEASGYCSTIDTECTSGRRYGESAGTLSGTCTSGGTTQDDADVNPMIDMGVDVDAMVDGPPAAQCPGQYQTITGGNAGHMYFAITVGATWAAQEAACQLTTTQAHLAVPDDIGELTALDTLIGGVNRYWIGVSDTATENTWARVTGGTQTYLPWQSPAPDDAGPGEDCVEAIPATHEFNDERCNTSRPAICECAP